MFVVRLIIDLLMLIGLALPFFQIVHARHARALIIATLGLTAICWGIYLVFSLRILHLAFPDRLDALLLRSYACSASAVSLLEEILSVRDEEKDLRTKLLIFQIGRASCWVRV